MIHVTANSVPDYENYGQTGISIAIITQGSNMATKKPIFGTMSYGAITGKTVSKGKYQARIQI